MTDTISMMNLFRKDICVKLSFHRIIPGALCLDEVSTFLNTDDPFRLIHTGLTMVIKNANKFPQISAK